MDDKDILLARVRELSYRASSNGYLTHTGFLSLSEQNAFFSFLRESHVDPNRREYQGSRFLLYGGNDEADRKMIFFLPYYLSDEVFLSQESCQIITCLKISPKNEKFADHLTHRDYLGALMKLGYEREMYGDILTDGTTGYVFLSASIASYVKDELTKVRHTVVDGTLIPCRECQFRPQFRELTLHLASERIDCVIAEVFHLSRRSSQELIGKDCVFVDGMTMMDNSFHLKPESRVSIRGYGKFIYHGNPNLTKKGRYVAKADLYA